jgi:hypothetical protein
MASARIALVRRVALAVRQLRQRAESGITQTDYAERFSWRSRHRCRALRASPSVLIAIGAPAEAAIPAPGHALGSATLVTPIAVIPRLLDDGALGTGRPWSPYRVPGSGVGRARKRHAANGCDESAQSDRSRLCLQCLHLQSPCMSCAPDKFRRRLDPAPGSAGSGETRHHPNGLCGSILMAARTPLPRGRAGSILGGGAGKRIVRGAQAE